METTHSNGTGPAGYRTGKTPVVSALDWIALVLMIIGGINWGLVGGFGVDLVASLFGDMTMVSRIIYVLVGLAALYGIYLLIRLGRDR